MSHVTHGKTLVVGAFVLLGIIVFKPVPTVAADHMPHSYSKYTQYSYNTGHNKDSDKPEYKAKVIETPTPTQQTTKNKPSNDKPAATQVTTTPVAVAPQTVAKQNPQPAADDKKDCDKKDEKKEVKQTPVPKHEDKQKAPCPPKHEEPKQEHKKPCPIHHEVHKKDCPKHEEHKKDCPKPEHHKKDCPKPPVKHDCPKPPKHDCPKPPVTPPVTPPSNGGMGGGTTPEPAAVTAVAVSTPAKLVNTGAPVGLLSALAALTAGAAAFVATRRTKASK